MSLSVDGRHCGNVYVIRCNGRIVAGAELGVLETSINRGLREFQRFVLHVAEVARIDSTGMGLMVRFLAHTRNRGGDLRLAAPPPFLTNLLQLTKLATIFRIYASEEEAIVSFLRDPNIASPTDAAVGPMVLFVDQSADLCAFVRTLLRSHGYEVLSTCLVQDAKMLLAAGKFDYVVLGPDSSRLPSGDVVTVIKTLAPSAAIIPLDGGFKHDDPERAGSNLLRAMESPARS